jgi:predicted permease
MNGERVARAVVGAASALVPGDRRREWLEEWRAELAALEGARAGGAAGLPSALGFAVGSVPHAMWTRTEGWTVDSVLQDVRYSIRVLRRAPGFTLVAALTLALGIGANASIFSLVNGLVLRSPAAIQAPDRLVQIARSYETAPRWDNFSWPAMKLIEAEARALSGVAGYHSEPFVLGRGADTERVDGQIVTANFFDVLGVAPHVGRLFQPDDDVYPGHEVVVLSHALWSRRYGGDPTVVGRSIQVGARPYEVVGVAQPGFTGVESIGARPGVFVLATRHPGYYGEAIFEEWGSSWIDLFGRLADGVAFEQATASMDVVTARLRAAAAVHEDIEVLLAPGVGLDPEGREEATRISVILMVIVGLVLLLTCTNVANLLLARAAGRKTEVGVRMALGGGRGRLARQHVTESLVLSLGATLLAVPIVVAAGDLLPLVFPYSVSVSLHADAAVWAFLVGIGLLTGLVFGTVPALAATRRDLAATLRDGASTGPRARTRLRDALVAAQLGLSLGLVAGAALLGRSVLNAGSAEPGFEPAGLAVGFVDLFATGRYDEESGRALVADMVEAAQRVPGVRSASIANQVPITGGHSRAAVRPAGTDDVSFEAEYVIVGPRYFETMGMPILRGRALRGLDDEPERVVLVNERLAMMFWPDEDPIGQELLRGEPWRVVGVVGDVQMRSLRSPANPAVYYPAAHADTPWTWLHLASETGEALAPAVVRELVASLDPELPVATVVDMQAAMTASMGETRTIGYLVGVFATLALVLAAVGLYGLVSFSVSQRRRELGIRIALGAAPESLVKLVLARGVAIVALGLVMGLGVSYGLGIALKSLLFGVTETDLVTLGGAALMLTVAAGIAAWVPARRASRVDAMISLRT